MDMKRQRPVVAIDGPAAAGKSTAGKRLAAELGFLYIDSGALYRTVALKGLREGIPLTDGPCLEEMMRTIRLQPTRTGEGMRMLLDGEDVTEEIRGEKAGFAASTVSALPEVRRGLLQLQRDLGREGGIVMDGRDIGTVIFPDAEAKFFITASLEERGRRRYQEMKEAGQPCTLEGVIEEIRKRDFQDSNRDHSPLVRAPDALLIDTTENSPDEVVALMRKRIERLAG